MWSAFFWENAHFAANFLAALVFFAMFWLYFDAWLERKAKDEIPKLLGILLLSISFVIHATQMETGIITTSFVNQSWLGWAFVGTRIAGYILLIVGVILDPLQPAPKTSGLLSALGVLSIKYQELSIVIFPILCAGVAWIYLRRATVGLEKHLKTVTISFFVLAVSELLSLQSLFASSTDVGIYKLVAPFGILWIIQHGVMLLGVTILGCWVWQYLTKRLQPQLFMIFTSTILGIFLLTTMVFTALLLKNMQEETLVRLETDVKVLSYGLESKKQAVKSDAAVLAQNTGIAQMIADGDRVGLAGEAQKFLLGKSLSFLVITDGDGRILARGEDRERIGDSLSDDSLVRRGLNGQEVATVAVKDGVLAPEVSVRAVAPIRQDGEVVGTVVAGTVTDNAFVDGIKAATGLEAAVYGGDVLAATTQIAADGKSRWIGTKNQESGVRSRVLEKGENYSGSQNVLNTPYFVSYMPLKDFDGATVGMLFVGRPQVTVLAAATRSIEVTFLVTAFLIVLAIGPAYFISRFITDQLS